MAKSYYYGIYNKYDYDAKENWQENLSKICNQGILSRRLRGASEELDEDIMKFNGLDYISICERLELSKTEHLNQWTAYHNYIYQNIGIIINGHIDIIIPTVLDSHKNPEREMKLHPDKHYCWMLDDRHVKNQITLKDFIGLFYPYENKYASYLLYGNDSILEEMKTDLIFLKEVLKQSELDIPIIDSSRDEYIKKLTPVLTYKKSDDEIRNFYLHDNF